MLFASDYNDNRVHIDDTCSNQEYYCPYCGAPLITRKGEVRQHHFAHKQSHVCSDTWAISGNHGYDPSPWHSDWQSLFPKANQEIKLCLGDTKHRADVLIDRTVVEFQHSIMPAKAFDDRNNFYLNLGYKIIWLFDLSDLYAKGQLQYQQTDHGLIFTWKNPKRAFNNYDLQSDNIDLFFQLSNEDPCSIVRVLGVSPEGFESFSTTNFMGKNDFLIYVGLKDGNCLPPCRDDLNLAHQYQQFKERYHIRLNKQQERALLAVEGSNLLLAVPGSGKTTVLVARLGYMMLCKNIAPEDILAITFSKSAAEEMKERFCNLFGSNIGRRINFRTIHSLSLEIYKDYCRNKKDHVRKEIDNREKKQLIRDILQGFQREYVSENDLQERLSSISYIKNMMLTGDQIRAMETEIPYLHSVYETYRDELNKKRFMDFDDQLVYAHELLKKRPDFADRWKAKYKYICVDEAQDTSKIQHKIIQLLAQDNNIFMVGDEDQSIYGFRAAYPKALLNFRYDYRNPYILRMERNYRSTKQIVEKAQAFISQNKGRYEKNMIANRADGESVSLISVASREAQYMYLLDVAKAAKTETAFLYRDNESAIVLVDLLLRNSIPFKLRKPEMNFFETQIVKDMTAFLSLALNEYDVHSFKQICHKGILCLKKSQRDRVIQACQEKQISVFDALDTIEDVKSNRPNQASQFRKIMIKIAKADSCDAISFLMEAGYGRYLKENHFDSEKIELLQILAKQEPTIKGFLRRLEDLEQHLECEFAANHKNPIILSTIHSSKGLEYDTVYMVDVYDGRFPSSPSNKLYRSKDRDDCAQEERRLFYVGITRAKNKLCLFTIDGKISSYIDQLFPENKALRLQKEEERRKLIKEQERMHTEQLRMQQEHARKQQEIRKREQEEKIRKAREYQKQLDEENDRRRREALKQKQEEKDRKAREYQEQLDEEDYKKRYNEVKGKFNQQETLIKDSAGQRWIQCERCHEIKESREFGSYGGPHHVNLGICDQCSGNSPS